MEWAWGVIGVLMIVAGIIGVYLNRNAPADTWEITGGPFMCGWDDDDDDDGFCSYVC